MFSGVLEITSWGREFGLKAAECCRIKAVSEVVCPCERRHNNKPRFQVLSRMKLFCAQKSEAWQERASTGAMPCSHGSGVHTQAVLPGAIFSFI